MSGDPEVRAALEAACRQDAFYGPGKGPSGYDEGLRKECAEIIAAFMMALPPFWHTHQTRASIGAAVIRAAQEDSGDGQ